MNDLLNAFIYSYFQQDYAPPVERGNELSKEYLEKEFQLIQEKKSKLSASQRRKIVRCYWQMKEQLAVLESKES